MRHARERLDLPLDKRGVLMGIDEHSASASLSRYESCVREAAIATALLLANVLNLPLAYLHCEDDDLAEILLAVSRMGTEDRLAILNSLGLRGEQINASFG